MDMNHGRRTLQVFVLRLQQWFLIWVRSCPRYSVSQFQEFSGLFHTISMTSDVTLCLTSSHTNAVHVCFKFEEKLMFYCSNYKAEADSEGGEGARAPVRF